MSLRVKMDFPIHMRLQIDGDKVVAKAGKAIVEPVRQRMDSGQGAEGPLPSPKSGGQPLKDTGQMIESIRFGKATSGRRARAGEGFVFPAGKRPDGKRNAMVLAVQLATWPELAARDPLGVTPELEQVAGKAAEDEIAKQMREPDKGLLAQRKELLKIFK